MKVGLYGILGVYNFGCEAIVRGAYNFIRTVYPESEIVYFSYSPEFDKRALADLNSVCSTNTVFYPESI
jgi:polysaccharide pyruvyl transferase WcaK-like protein